MKVIHDINEFPRDVRSIVTTGTFDGVHIGHRKIINKLTDIARAQEAKSVIVTFWPHPRLVLFPEDNELKLLNTIEERIQLIGQNEVDYLVVINFTHQFSRFTSEEFIKNILVNKLNTQTLVIGYDHRFGKNREGSFEYLREHSMQYGFNVEEIPAQDIDHVAVSSTKIRNALLEGNIKQANDFLGYNYFFNGTVIQGNKLGRQIGFPTANLKIEDKNKLIPADGVYAATIRLGMEIYYGMLNIGIRPTVSNQNERTVEVNIFEFDREIYNEQAEITLLEKVRDEIKFKNLEELKQQLSEDKKNVLAIIS